jgi:hypothetical protein
MKELGYCKNILRLPMTPILEKNEKIILEELKKYS